MRLNRKLKVIACSLSIAVIAGKAAAGFGGPMIKVIESGSPHKAKAEITLKITVPPICEIIGGEQASADEDFKFTVNSNAPGNTVLAFEDGGVGVLRSFAGQTGEFKAQLKENTNDSPVDTMTFTGVGSKTGFITTNITKSTGLHYGDAEGKVTLTVSCEN